MSTTQVVKWTKPCDSTGTPSVVRWGSLQKIVESRCTRWYQFFRPPYHLTPTPWKWKGFLWTLYNRTQRVDTAIHRCICILRFTRIQSNLQIFCHQQALVSASNDLGYGVVDPFEDFLIKLDLFKYQRNVPPRTLSPSGADRHLFHVVSAV